MAVAAAARAAGVAGRPRRYDDACQIYGQLITTWPDSAAATNSLVALGQVRQGALGQPAESLVHFDGYLATAPAGLLPEAIEPLDEPDDEGDATAVAPGDDDGNQTMSPARRPPGAHLALTAGYAPTILSGQGPYLHGATFGLGVGIGRHLELGGEFMLVETADLGVPTSDVALARWPVRVHAAGIIGSDRLDLALKLGAAVESWRVRDLDYEAVEADLGELQTDVAFTIAARARLRPLPWLAPYAEMGVDLYPSTNRYLYLGHTQLRRSAAQPRLVVGVMLLPGAR